MNEIRHVRTDVSRIAISQRNPHRDLFADERFKRNTLILGNELDLKAEKLRDRLASGEAQQLQFLLGGRGESKVNKR